MFFSVLGGFDPLDGGVGVQKFTGFFSRFWTIYGVVFFPAPIIVSPEMQIQPFHLNTVNDIDLGGRC